jgi:hypothetical protein
LKNSTSKLVSLHPNEEKCIFMAKVWIILFLL